MGEELVERLRELGVDVARIGRHAREAHDGRPAARERNQAGRQLGARALEDLLDLARAHRQRVLRDLEDVAVQKPARRDP